jgi:EmrB/QacA subfamily drug resistance transporter
MDLPDSPRRTNRALTMTALVACVFMSALEATVVATAMPTVIAELGGIRLYGWVTAGYLLASTVSVPIFGKLADLRGRKPWLLFGVAIFLVGSVGSGLSQSLVQLIFFRVVQGVGAGAMGPLALTVVSDLYSFRERGRVQGFFGSVWAISAIIGPLLGGAMMTVLSWRWVFFVNVPIGLAAALLLVGAFHESAVPHSGRIHWKSAAALTLGSSLLLAAGEGREGLLLLPVAVLLLAIFTRLERGAPEPILPTDLFRDRLFVVNIALTTILGGISMGTVTFLPLFVQGVMGGSPTEAGASISAMLVTWPLASVVTGRLLPRIGFRPPIVMGSFLVAAAAVGLAMTVQEATSTRALHIMTGALGLGMGMAVSSSLIAVQTSVRWERRGTATASSIFFRTMGGALAVAAFGSMLGYALSQSFPPDVIARVLGPDRAAHVELTGPLVGALASGIHRLFVIMGAAGAFAFGTALLFPSTRPSEMAGAMASESSPPSRH